MSTTMSVEVDLMPVRSFTDITLAIPKTRDYMDSLKPPSPGHFERIARTQQKNEELNRATRLRSRSLRAEAQWRAENQTNGHLSETHNAEEEAEAAETIQKTFRGYRVRREMSGFGLNANTRWVSAIREAQFRESNRPRPRTSDGPGNTNNYSHPSAAGHRLPSAMVNWKKATIVARRAGHDDIDESESSSSADEDETPEALLEARKQRFRQNAERKSEARMMGLQYFLEMVDAKHRYGSNLRSYHEEWKRSDTMENFFYWLDQGEGRYVELESCSRERLEREQIRYLSREERQYYLVRVDEEGKLRWVKNDALIDTTEEYKDSIHGIVPSDDPTPGFNPNIEQPTSQQAKDEADSSSISSAESVHKADRAAKPTNSESEPPKGVKKVSRISASTILDKLLRGSVKKNTWIFVADTSFRLYVGIKSSGAFQHSSFLQGSRISAAGSIKIKNGCLSSLSPLSGHYRPPTSNFRAFVRKLKDDGVNTHHVSISKSYSVLVGLEVYTKTRRKGKNALSKLKHQRDKIMAPTQTREKEEAEKEKSESAEKERRHLEETKEDEGGRRATAVKMMQKMRIGAAGAEGSGDGGAVTSGEVKENNV